jgi:predicted nucleic acid-binding protein
VPTDDRAAREQAHGWNLPLLATFGVLLLAIQDGSLTVDSITDLI